jgi:hypothetical protein
MGQLAVHLAAERRGAPGMVVSNFGKKFTGNAIFA